MTKLCPRILQIIPTLDTGGAELSTLEIAEAILSAGGEAFVVTEGGRLIQHLRVMGAKVFFCRVGSKNPLLMLKNALHLSRIIVGNDIDLVHARSRAPAWSALWAAGFTRIPFLTTYHGAYNEDNIVKSLYNSVMVRGKLTIANSDYIRDLILSRYEVKKSQIRIIPRGVDEKKFNPDSIQEERIIELRKMWGVSPYTRIILHPARLTEWKGQFVVLEAISRIKEESLLENVCFVMAGGDQGRYQYKNSLEKKISEKGLQKLVRIVGHIEDMTVAYKTAEASVIASTLPEAFGRTSIEAQSMECPIIATRLGATIETVLSSPEYSYEQRTGWLIPANDPEALSNTLLEVLKLAPQARREIGRRGRNHISKNYSLYQMRLKTLRVYDELLETDLEGRYKARELLKIG